MSNKSKIESILFVASKPLLTKKIAAALKINDKEALEFLKSGSDVNLAEYLDFDAARAMEKAIRFAFKNTPKGQICLLSTASPSYSIWKNFEEKGNLFQRLIKANAK